LTSGAAGFTGTGTASSLRCSFLFFAMIPLEQLHDLLTDLRAGVVQRTCQIGVIKVKLATS
jgi:hypothetical protein